MKLASISMAAALAICAGSASFAQPAPPPAGSHAEGHHWQRPDPAQMAERHAQHLRDALQLRPDQEPALRALVAAMQPPAGEREHMRKDHEEGAGLSTPQRLDRMAARIAEHEARFRQHADAVKRFYAQLSPAQQKAFDAMPMKMGHGEHQHGMGGEHHGLHGGPEGHDHGAPPPHGD
ncbi:Spy/CpxP family protein refolding chaperone [Phenylobacterium sp.]|uniref:Spy/CpxP family protein refolding chaperone n=1 Tax=Phenylobacterium sp. TaxID=1871053 RepID=UPI002DED78AC|nr:Spy/CpxP family protein refolding chaperone [Phenylobacterium sp.]